MEHGLLLLACVLFFSITTIMTLLVTKVAIVKKTGIFPQWKSAIVWLLVVRNIV
jgi:hypothetical protein